MKISLITCMQMNRGIGFKGKMPWGDRPLDGRHFANLTKGCPLIMGHSTWKSLPIKPLPGRPCLVLTKSLHETARYPILWRGGFAVNSIHEAIVRSLDFVKSIHTAEIFVIGGESVYRQFLPHASTVYQTVNANTEAADCYFPQLGEEFHLVEQYCEITRRLLYLTYQRT